MIFCSSESPQPSISITVRSLRAQHDGAEILVGVVLENGEQREQKSLPITVEQYYEIKPMRGEISEEMYDRLEEASALCRAIRCGENLLTYGANSTQMLAQKIARHGFRRDVSLAAAQKLRDNGLINEKKDLSREVEKCLRKLWGAKRIKNHLWSRGFDAEVMSDLQTLMEDVDFAQNCAALIQKHYGGVPQDSADRQRMIAGLGRYGYSFSEIRSAIDRLSKEKS